jgi:glycosyltransferase involved in cell wall biosynthesis
MVTSFYPPYNFGGDGIFVESLAELLVGHGHSVSVVHCEDAFRINGHTPDVDLPKVRIVNGVEIHRLKSRAGALSPLLSHQTGHPALKTNQLRDLLNRDFDVINFHNVSLMGGPGVLKFGNASVKLYTLHEHWLICATHILWKYGNRACDGRECLRCSAHARIPPQWWRYTGQTAAALKQIDCFISPSQFTADQHHAILGQIPIQVLPHFSRVQADEAPESGNGFVYVGRITASKGIEPLLRVFSGLPQHRLTVVGAGDLLQLVRKKYEHCPNIEFLPFVDQSQLRSIYTKARGLILPSLAPETFGLTVVEALACGTPSIVRDAGGCSEIVRDAGVGTIYKTDEELVAAIDRMSNDKEAELMAKKAQAACSHFYSSERYVDQYVKLIRRLG